MRASERVAAQFSLADFLEQTFVVSIPKQILFELAKAYLRGMKLTIRSRRTRSNAIRTRNVIKKSEKSRER